MTVFLNDRLLGYVRKVANAQFVDICQIGTTTTTVDSYGQPVETISYGSNQICSFVMKPGSERNTPDAVVLTYDASVRLPLSVAPASINYIKITKHYGETLGTPLVFQIVGPVQRGMSETRLLLKKVST